MSKALKDFARSHTLDLSKNDKKIVTSFIKQVLKQIGGREDMAREVSAMQVLLEKIKTATEPVKLTKIEYSLLREQFGQNIQYLKKEMPKAWFFKRWMMKSLYMQYSLLYDEHLKEK